MADKKPRGVAVAISAAIAIALAIALVVVFMNGRGADAPARPSGPSNLGPETVQGPGSSVTAASFNEQSAQLAAVTDGDAPPEQAPDAQSADTDPVNLETDYLVFTTTFPPGSADDPAVSFLKRDAQRYLARIRANAEAEHARLKALGQTPMGWEVVINWKETARAGGIVSYSGIASEYTGGAHPAYLFDTHIARVETGEQLAFDDMLIIKRSPSPALQIAICEALKSAKIERGGEATIYDEPIVCAGPDANAKTDKALIALAPSDQRDRFGGVYAYYPPYEVGPYSEGSYSLVVQQDVFAEDLRADFAPLFAGKAPPPPE